MGNIYLGNSLLTNNSVMDSLPVNTTLISYSGNVFGENWINKSSTVVPNGKFVGTVLVSDDYKSMNISALYRKSNMIIVNDWMLIGCEDKVLGYNINTTSVISAQVPNICKLVYNGSIIIGIDSDLLIYTISISDDTLTVTSTGKYSKSADVCGGDGYFYARIEENSVCTIYVSDSELSWSRLLLVSSAYTSTCLHYLDHKVTLCRRINSGRAYLVTFSNNELLKEVDLGNANYNIADQNLDYERETIAYSNGIYCICWGREALFYDSIKGTKFTLTIPGNDGASYRLPQYVFSLYNIFGVVSTAGFTYDSVEFLIDYFCMNSTEVYQRTKFTARENYPYLAVDNVVYSCNTPYRLTITMKPATSESAYYIKYK